MSDLKRKEAETYENKSHYQQQQQQQQREVEQKVSQSPHYPMIGIAKNKDDVTSLS